MPKFGHSLLKKVGLYETGRAAWHWVARPPAWRQNRTRLRFIANLVRGPKRGAVAPICFDIGANVGDYTSDLLWAGVRTVVAVEPQANCVDTLRNRFGKDPRVTLVPAAVGPEEGSITMYTSDASQISSCSKEWVDAVKTSGRFEGHNWNKAVEVPITTLDKLIAAHGLPGFCKIDVEGFELDVLRGLSTPIPVMSFEFSPEMIERTCDCVARLSSLAGDYRFNYCPHGHHAHALAEHQPGDVFQHTLRNLPPQAMKWGGDVYAWNVP